MQILVQTAVMCLSGRHDLSHQHGIADAEQRSNLSGRHEMSKCVQILGRVPRFDDFMLLVLPTFPKHIGRTLKNFFPGYSGGPSASPKREIRSGRMERGVLSTRELLEESTLLRGEGVKLRSDTRVRTQVISKHVAC